MATFVLRPLHTHVSAEKKSCKESPVGFSNPRSLKMVFALLTKLITVHMQLTIVHFWDLSLNGLFTLRRRLTRSLVRLQIGSHKLFEQFIGGRRSRSGNKTERGRDYLNEDPQLGLGPWQAHLPQGQEEGGFDKGNDKSGNIQELSQ